VVIRRDVTLSRQSTAAAPRNVILEKKGDIRDRANAKKAEKEGESEKFTLDEEGERGFLIKAVLLATRAYSE